MFDSQLRELASRAPSIGEHTDEILSDVLGLGEREIRPGSVTVAWVAQWRDQFLEFSQELWLRSTRSRE